MAEGRIFITFDVDGTLIRSAGEDANKLHKDAFSHAFKKVFGVEGTIEAIQHHGSTDGLVLVKTLEHYGVPTEKSMEKLPELYEAMVNYALAHESDVAQGLELLPGVRTLLEDLSRRDNVIVGLVTGNLEPIAWQKMRGLGLEGLFSTPKVGGFGSDHLERGELVKIARARAEERFPGPAFRLRVHVGDTPNDVKAANSGGSLAIGVCTGVFSREQLQHAGGEETVILDGLADNEPFLKACGLRP